MKINGAEQIIYDAELANGYARINCAIVDAACAAFLKRKDLSYSPITRAGLSAKLRERASRDRQIAGEATRKLANKRASVEGRRVCHRTCPDARFGSATSVAHNDANSQGLASNLGLTQKGQKLTDAQFNDPRVQSLLAKRLARKDGEEAA